MEPESTAAKGKSRTLKSSLPLVMTAGMALMIGQSLLGAEGPAGRQRSHGDRVKTFSLDLLAPAFAQSADLSADDLNKLKATEEKIFIRTYDDDAGEARVARIEKRMFGEAESGDLHARLAKIVEIARPFEHKEAKNNNGKGQGRPTSGASGAQTGGRRQLSPEEEKARQEDAREQARVRAMAAKDEEVNQLFAEAVSLYKGQRSAEAMDKFLQVVRLAPDMAEAHFSLGVIYESQNHFKEALASYNRAAELNPSKREYREAVSVVQKKAKNDDSDDPREAANRALAGEAAAAYSRGEYMSALGLYKELDEKKPKQAKVKFNIGTIYLALKNPVQALEYFEQAYKLKPDEPKFKEACDKLRANLKASDTERQAPDEKWNHPGKTQINFVAATTGGGRDGGGQSSKMPPPATAFGLMLRRHKDGVEITTVGIGSRAAQCGLLKGDLIKAVDGVVIDSIDQVNAIFASKGNTRCQLLIQRGSKIGQVVF